MASQPNTPAFDDESYAYMFRSGERRFLFICNFGAGIESVAQLVEDVDLGGNLIRKPREIKILDIIKDTFKAPEPGLSFNIVECYGHEYFKSKDHDEAGLVKYHSVSYWKLCNGRSLYKRWLTGDILPPTVAVARMVRQVLGTLHHLYTAGEKPIYHGDLHFGNIWIHWRENCLLPDFYIGDFADAGFFDSDYHAAKPVDTVAPPLKDLHKFCRSLDALCELLGPRRGCGNPGAKALRRLSLDIADVLVDNRGIGDFDPPPNLKPLIRLAQNLEDMFGEGGEAGETDTAPYVNFVTGERIGALMAEGQRGLVVFASKANALRPGYTEGLAHVPRVIHGPWQLVRAPDWVPVEGDVTHHRPNRNRLEPGEDLSTSKQLTGDMFLGSVFLGEAFVEPYIGELNSDGSYTSSCQSDAQPDATAPSSQANFRAAGDDGKRSRLFIDASLQLPPDDPSVSPESEGAQSPSSLVSSLGAESFVILEPLVPENAQGPQNAEEPSPAFSWTKGDDADFQVRQLESDEPDDWGLSLEFHDECEARVASHRRRLAARAKASSQQTQATIPTISVIEPADDKLQHWHTMLHGAECRCAGHVWQAEMEAMFMRERVRRARGGLLKEADWSFCEPAGCDGGVSY